MPTRRLHIPNHEFDDDLAEVCAEFGIDELAAFGSRVTGVDVTPTSDLDLLYELAPGARLGWGIGALEDRLAAIFGVRVDLVSKKYLHRLLRDDILAQATVIYAA